MSLGAAFLSQAENNAALGSPFTARLLRLLPDLLTPDLAVVQAMKTYEGDIGPYGHSLPLRLLGGLHALVLTGEAPDLVAVYPPNATPDDGVLAAVLARVLNDQSAWLLDWLTLPPQTNEVRRSAALIAGASVVAQRFGLPLALSELGASAGLNLMFDRYALTSHGWQRGAANPALTLTPEWTGARPPDASLRVVERRGVDLKPMEVHNPDQRLRLLSYLWADQPHRMDLTQAAIAAHAAQVDKGDAADWLAQRLATPHPGAAHLIYHTIAWQYFPAAVQDACLTALDTAGAKATAEAPLAHLSMEADGGHGAALTLTLWPEGETLTLGRVDFHGRWLDWQHV